VGGGGGGGGGGGLSVIVYYSHMHESVCHAGLLSYI